LLLMPRQQPRKTSRESFMPGGDIRCPLGGFFQGTPRTGPDTMVCDPARVGIWEEDGIPRSRGSRIRDRAEVEGQNRRRSVFVFLFFLLVALAKLVRAEGFFHSFGCGPPTPGVGAREPAFKGDGPGGTAILDIPKVDIPFKEPYQGSEANIRAAAAGGPLSREKITARSRSDYTHKKQIRRLGAVRPSQDSSANRLRRGGGRLQ